MFLLASLTLWELEHDVASEVDIRKVLMSISVSLDEAYGQIFERIGKQGGRMKQLALQAIMWIYATTSSNISDHVPKPVSTDSIIAHVPKALSDLVAVDATRAFEAVDTYRMTSVLLLLLVAAIALYLYVAPPALVVRLSIQ
ncbi:hypothetical protein CPB85DRAFT_1255503 [Mucidula mucida]|nr:hypothetical protein CPB85DRAFT_1255503 [Mucidula mucida]